ncbi:MAG: hypothetical protein P8J75_10685 [Actinomycetota bacterium]|nr:hypothetical protein [Actinomycetota bacterium]
MGHYFLKPRHLLATGSLLLLALSVAACSDSPDPEAALSRDEIFDRIDQDGDGVALRSDYQMTVTLMDPTKVVASHPQGDVTVKAVLDSLEASPPSGLTDPANPTNRLFAARLTSMLRLRLAAVAIQGAGFAIDFEVDDERLNSQVQAHLAADFEDWAREEAFQADPRLEKFATPHCVTLIAVATEAQANIARERLIAGEPAEVVASQLNAPGITTSVDGDVGCANLLTWANTFGENAAPLGEMSVGEVSKVVSMSSEYSPTGRLWMVFFLRELQEDQKDPTALGPFAQQVLANLVTEYPVTIDPSVGTWDSTALSVAPVQ